jgi:hypothetical protein
LLLVNANLRVAAATFTIYYKTAAVEVIFHGNLCEFGGSLVQ